MKARKIIKFKINIQISVVLTFGIYPFQIEDTRLFSKLDSKHYFMLIKVKICKKHPYSSNHYHVVVA